MNNRKANLAANRILEGANVRNTLSNNAMQRSYTKVITEGTYNYMPFQSPNWDGEDMEDAVSTIQYAVISDVADALSMRLIGKVDKSLYDIGDYTGEGYSFELSDLIFAVNGKTFREYQGPYVSLDSNNFKLVANCADYSDYTFEYSYAGELVKIKGRTAKEIASRIKKILDREFLNN